GDHRARRARARAHWGGDRAAVRPRRPRAPALGPRRPPRDGAGQPARAHRRGLPRRGAGPAPQHGPPRVVRDRAGRPHRPAAPRAGRDAAGRRGRRPGAERTRGVRLWVERPLVGLSVSPGWNPARRSPFLRRTQGGTVTESRARPRTYAGAAIARRFRVGFADGSTRVRRAVLRRLRFERAPLIDEPAVAQVPR